MGKAPPQRGTFNQLPSGRWRIRYFNQDGHRVSRSGFRTRTEARAWFEQVERPRLLGMPQAQPDRTLTQHVADYLAVLAVTREPATVKTQRIRLAYATNAFGTVNLRDLQHRAREIAAWRATLSPGMRYPCTSALRQALDVAVRWGLTDTNPARAAGPNPQPKVREVTPLTPDEVAQVAAKTAGTWGPLIRFAAETGLRPEEWIALERGDWLHTEHVMLVQRAYSDGRLNPYGKTSRSRRRVPLTPTAEQALHSLTAHIDTRLLFPAPKGGHLDLHNWRRRHWYPALNTAGVARRGPYALRHTFATEALAAGLSVFELARMMGTSVDMIDRTYGHLAQGSERHMRERLAARHDGHVVATAAHTGQHSNP